METTFMEGLSNTESLEDFKLRLNSLTEKLHKIATLPRGEGTR